MISIVVAMDQNRVIGKDNRLPWHLPADLAYFKAVTIGHVIVMGRKTYEAIGKPLPGRENVVLTRDQAYEAEGCIIVHSVGEALSAFDGKQIDVIGGAQIIAQFLPYTDTIYLTLIEESFEGDTFFPEISEEEWKLVSRKAGIKDEKNPYTYYFLVYKRKR
ncbi:dihydrofolate reductase [Aneurinibacillus tyrosinisolvens]|uniref:dihydrofolate reductase n=1 Tax=Aneurinibacillus tyrosinisolvens TaxID=1443435 RepID=UPI00063F8B5A|nr:dihydrofolate reductase [Aneurinibacillus tyrosinisolvens]